MKKNLTIGDRLGHRPYTEVERFWYSLVKTAQLSEYKGGDLNGLQ